MKTNELTGAALDWAVWKIEYSNAKTDEELLAALMPFTPSTNWAQGGPIIEREKLELRPGLYHSELWSCWGQTRHGERLSQQGKTGPTPLIAAMRCYVASKLGDVVEIPKELTK